MYNWKVCPIQGRQLRDVRPEDIYGDFRLCNTYRGGGGYDRFPEIAMKRQLSCSGEVGLQFVVQLYGCTLDCYYCYVTKDGIYGQTVNYTTSRLVANYMKAFVEHQCGVFHLMGGAPALYHHRWPELLFQLPEDCIFHSDLMLVEREYDKPALHKCNKDNALYAVDIKGVSPENHFKNTGRKLDEALFWRNFSWVVDSGINFYLTFTNPDDDDLERFKDKVSARYGDWVLDDHFVIELVEYEALKEDYDG